MSAPAKDGPETPAERKKGVSRYLSKMKTALRRSDGSKRLSFSLKSPAAASSSAAAGPSTQKATAPTPASVKTKEPKEAGLTKVMRSQIQAERARKLGERFAVSIEPYEWEQKEDKEALRIEKPIRMRIHRACHRCNMTFGGNKICAQCQHTRCKQCPRYPPKKQRKEKAKKGVFITPGAIEADTYWGMKDDLVLTMPCKKTGGQPLVRKKPKQRVRRNCHECKALFLAGSKNCLGCGHIRCTDCPRDPAKKKKYPDGYPGDAFSTNTSLLVKYSCNKCTKVFPAVPHPDTDEGKALITSGADPQMCVRCGHLRCPDCPRAPPQKVELAPDPEVLKSLEAKLAALKVSSAT